MKSKFCLRFALLAALVVFSLQCFAQTAAAPEITVAAAADLSSALKDIAADFEKQSGVSVKLSFAASGALTQQIQNGAPFDVFFSADMDYPRQLIAAGKADNASLYRYAVGKLVLWAPADSPIKLAHKGMSVLLESWVTKIAIANPQHAPYGRAAEAALKHENYYDKVSSKLVFGENVAQAAQFVESGNAQVGFIALAHVMATRQGKYWIVPEEDYSALDQGVVVITESKHKKEAEQFVAYIKTKEASEVLKKYGFSLPEK